jgi:hypothetical protein
MTKRELKIQQLADETLETILPAAEKHLDKLGNFMEVVYYRNRISTMMEIMLSIKYGILEKE